MGANVDIQRQTWLERASNDARKGLAKDREEVNNCYSRTGFDKPAGACARANLDRHLALETRA
jgi:hypothetical protein